MVLEGDTKTTATSLAHSLSKDEVLAIYSNSSPVSKQLQNCLKDDDRVFFHSGGKMDNTFRLIALLSINSSFILLLIAAGCFLATIGGAWEGETTRGLAFFLLAVISFPCYCFVLGFLPFRNYVFLTQSTLFIIKTRLILPPMVFTDPLHMIKKFSCTTTIESHDRSSMTDENADRIANENSHLKGEGLFYVSKGGNGHIFSISNANDLTDNFARVFDTTPTCTISSQKSNYLRGSTLVLVVFSITYFVGCFLYSLDSDISFSLTVCFYFLCLGVFSIYIVISVFLKRNKFDIHHSFDFSS